MKSVSSLVQKYNIPGPRYTSYPTVPYWKESTFNASKWTESVKRSFNESNSEQGISLYIHLPFCESLCTFCGCNKRITKRHEVESPYIDSLLQEWQLYLQLFENRPIISELHFGGGTPTFFSPVQLKRLIDVIFESADRSKQFSFSFEGHPNNTTEAHMQALYDLGFRRNSFGVQDYDPLVQKTINRIQPFANVKKVTDISREIGYTSVSHDLVFGLPHQTLEGVEKTIEMTRELAPDRIAFYSYAHVPWIKGLGQRGYDESDLPSASLKRSMYESGKQLLAEIGYKEIGMDHFALESDSLYQSYMSGKLHRNFMGYTTDKTQLMIGLGVSSISDSWYYFAQNEKNVEDYQKRVSEGVIPVFRGHGLDTEDLVIRKHILNLMCQFETNWEADNLKFEGLEGCNERLKEMQQDELIEIQNNSLLITEKGKPFVRNVCMAFDLHLVRKAPQTRVFSMTI